MGTGTGTRSEHSLVKRLKALVLGGIDMSDVVESAGYLLDTHAQPPRHDGGVPWRARRTLETGMFVTYARPFASSRGLQKLERAPGLSPDLIHMHDEIVDLRHTVYAHTDDNPFRQIRKPAGLEVIAEWPEDLAAWVRDPEARFEDELLEQWLAPTPIMLDAVHLLADANRAYFAAQIELVTNRLRLRAGTPNGSS